MRKNVLVGIYGSKVSMHAFIGNLNVPDFYTQSVISCFFLARIDVRRLSPPGPRHHHPPGPQHNDRHPHLHRTSSGHHPHHPPPPRSHPPRPPHQHNTKNHHPKPTKPHTSNPTHSPPETRDIDGKPATI